MKTLQYYIVDNKKTLARNSIMVDEMDDDFGRMPRTWRPIAREEELPRMTEEPVNAGRQAYRVRALREQKAATRREGHQVKTMSTQTTELTAAEKATIARRTKNTCGIPISETTDAELAQYCVTNGVRLRMPPGVYDQIEDYPSPWIAECAIRRGGRKGLRTSKVTERIDMAYVGYTGDPRQVKKEHDPTRIDRLHKVLIDVTRQPSTGALEVTLRELIAKERPNAEVLHDLMSDNHDKYRGIVKRPGRKIQQEAATATSDTATEASADTHHHDGETETPQPDDTAGAKARQETATAQTNASDSNNSEREVAGDRDEPAKEPEEPDQRVPDNEKFRLSDGRMAGDLIGKRVTKEFKRKGGKGSRGVFHGRIDKVTYEERLRDPIVLWVLYDEDQKYVRYNQNDIAAMTVDDEEAEDVAVPEVESEDGGSGPEGIDGTSEGREQPKTREMGIQTDEVITPTAAWFSKDSTEWGETIERKYRSEADFEHARLGHPARFKLEQLQKIREENPDKDLGIKPLNVTHEIHSEGKCPCCLSNKGMVRRKIGNKHRRAKARRYLDRVHMDESGILQVPSYGGARYYTVFVDEATRWKWVYIHEKKTDIYDVLQRFLIDAETATDRVRAIRFDQSSEHLADDYRAHLILKGIRIEAPCTESHYQNGIAEKAVRDAAEMSRCMLNGEGYKIPRDMWGWAIRYAVFIQNRLPHYALHCNEKRRLLTPYFKRFGEEADMSQIKPFGCEIFIHRDRQSPFVKDPKFDEHAIRGMFVGRAEDGGSSKGLAIKGDIVWTLETGPRVIISDQTTAIETRFPQMLGPVEWEATVGNGRKSRVDFEDNDWGKGTDGTPFYVTKEEALRIGGGETLLDATVTRRRDGAKGIVVRKDENAKLYKVYFLKNQEEWPHRRKIAVKGKYTALTLHKEHLDNALDYEIGEYDTPWRRNIVYKENEERRQEYKTLSREEKAAAKANRRAAKDPVIQKLKSDEAPISSRIYEPKTYRQAMACEDRELWQASIKKELEGLMNMGVLEVVKGNGKMRTIDSKFVFKVKYNPDGSVDKYKSRLVLRGDKQVAGRDYDPNKVFAPVANQTLARTMLSIAANLDLEVDMVDVRQAYLYADLEEKHLVVQPAKGVTETLGLPSDSWFRVRKSNYGLVQSGGNWFREFVRWAKQKGFTRASEDDCLFSRERTIDGKTEIVLILQYVDDLLLFSSDRTELDTFKAELEAKYAIDDKGPASYYLGVEIERDRKEKTIAIHQGKYIRDMLEGIGDKRRIREHDTPMKPGEKLVANTGAKVDQAFYQSCIGTLLYLSGWTRPDIAYTVSELSKHTLNPGVEHHEAMLYLIGYLKRTIGMRIVYGGAQREGLEFGPNELGGYVDASFAGCPDTRRSKGGYILFLNGGPISWKSKDQSIVALSTTDSEIDAAVKAIREVKGIRTQLFGLGLEQQEPTTLFEDNAATISISHCASLRETTKHLGYRRGFLRDEVEKKEVTLKTIATSVQTADVFTKSLSRVLHERHCEQIFANFNQAKEKSETA